MRYGYFDDANKEYVIKTPRTPLPWINYLGSRAFFTLLSNTAGGYAFYRDARLRRITRYRYNNSPADMEGFRVYIKENGEVWNPGWMPVKTRLDNYECRHGMGYSVISGSKNKIKAVQTLLVPVEDDCLLMKLDLKNESDEVRKFEVFTYIEFCLWNALDDASNFQRNYSCGEVEVEPDAIYHKTEYRERRNHYTVMWANEKYDGFDTSRDAFCGLYSGPEAPEAVFGHDPANAAKDKDSSGDESKVSGCTGSIAHGWAPVGAMQFHISLAAGEEKTLVFGLGYIENDPEEKWEPAASDNSAAMAGSAASDGSTATTGSAASDRSTDTTGSAVSDRSMATAESAAAKASAGIINKSKARRMISRYPDVQAFDDAMTALKAEWEELLAKYHVNVNSGDEETDKKVDRMVNIWNQYQCMVTFNMSRSASYFESGMGRGMGFRDSCQDLLGFVHIIPERARERILDIAATQFPDGSAYHQYQPLTKKGNLDIGSGFNDDPLWLIAGTSAYLAETGDFGILDEMVDFDNDPAQAATLMEHLRRSVNYTISHLGPHGLPLIGRADWNDCLNLNCFSEIPGESFQTTGPSEGPVAESVFIAGMFVKYGTAYADICRKLAENETLVTNSAAAASEQKTVIDLSAVAAGQKPVSEQTVSPLSLAKTAMEAKELMAKEKIASGYAQEADTIMQAVKAMEQAILTAGWDGKWFIRAYDAFGNPVGSMENDEGQIFIEPQGMCVMAGVGIETGEAGMALRSVAERLDTKYGIVLLNPAYTTYRLNLGEISSYPPGYKENAGIFCHNNPWIICAETMLGNGSRAFELYKKTAPAFIEDISEIHRTEPYVYSQMIAGKDAPTFGEAKNSWLTGTAAWTFTCISQYILGVMPVLDGLKVEPVIPPEWNGFELTRIFRGTSYHIKVENPVHVQRGIVLVQMNGRELELTSESAVILPETDAPEAEVLIIMG